MMTVMLVDDEEIIRTGIAQMVPWQEHNLDLVYQAKQGLEALEYLCDNPVDIVITDIRMPVMDGIELVKCAKEKHINTRFIMLTGFNEFEYARSAMRFSVQHYLLKPCNEHDIIEACLKTAEEIAAAENKEWEVSSLADGATQNFILRYLTSGECSKKDLSYFANKINPQDVPFRLVVFRGNNKEPLLDYALLNIAGEIFGERSLYHFSLPEHIVLFFCAGEEEDTQRLARQAAVHMSEFYSVNYTFLVTPTTDFGGVPNTYWKALENRAAYQSYQDACVNEIIRIVDENMQDPNLNLKWIARNKLFMNENYLSKLFQRITGIRFTQYLTDRRISKAKVMIQEEPDIKLVTLCGRLGFENNPTYFSTLFKTQSGMTVTQFRNTV